MIGSARKDRMTMARFKTSAALLALGFAASGCGMDNHDGPLTHVSNPSLYSINQPVVQRTDYVFDVNSTGDGIGPGELARLDDWFRSLELGYGDRVSIDERGGYADPRTRDDIARAAADRGVLLANGAPLTAGAAQPGAVRVIVSRSTASVPGCPIWEDPQIGASTRTSTNFGCSVNSNIAQMIGDPNDLVLGQSSDGEPGGAIASRAIKAYRDRAPSGAGGAKVEGGK
jgi:pilus assembly protein CpaD